ncbi:MAG TPA: outer membrane beta-barrel protein [Cytophagaceae bacterium]
MHINYYPKVKRWSILLLGLISIQLSSFAQQISGGIKLNPSFSTIYSKSLKDNYAVQKNKDPKVTNYNVSSRHRFSFGFGGFAEYAVNDKISVLGEPTLNFFRSNIHLNYHYMDLDSLGNGNSVRIASENTVKLTHFNLTISGRYTMGLLRKYFVLGGPSITITSRPKINTKETLYLSDYIMDLVETTEETGYSGKATLDNFKKFKIGFMLGAGKRFDVFRRDMFVDIRYTYFFNKSPLYTSNAEFDDAVLLGGVFSETGKRSVEKENSDKKIQDFRMGLFTFSVRYTLYKK